MWKKARGEGRKRGGLKAEHSRVKDNTLLINWTTTTVKLTIYGLRDNEK